MTDPLTALWLMSPQLIVALTGAVVLVVDLVWMRPDGRRDDGAPHLAHIGIAGLVVAGVFVVARTGGSQTILWSTITVDPLTVFFELLFIFVAIAILLMSAESLPGFSDAPAEFYTLVIWCTLGNMLVAPASELFTLFLCLQLTSLPLIVLIGYARNDPRSGEAALKYLVMVLVSTALFLYGLSLVYGGFGVSGMEAIGAMGSAEPFSAMVIAGLVLMLAGFAFKVTAAPFQLWVPDVYQGAPTPVTAFLSVGSKLAGFALIMRFSVVALGAHEGMHAILAVLAVASMLIGNLGALQQDDIKRLLAYSGVAQAGYILVGLSAMSVTGMTSVLFYLAAYALANLLAFVAVIACTSALGGYHIGRYKGLVARSPLAAFALTVALLSLAGLPLTAGFMAKFYAFLAAAEAGEYVLAIIAVVNAVMAFYYYLRIVWNLYVQEEEGEPFSVSPRMALLMVVATTGVVLVGVWPGPLLAAAHRAAEALFGM